jgi:hypothetical protein
MNPSPTNPIFSSPEGRPVDPATGKPQPPREQPGYYPGFSTLAQERAWEAATRNLIRDRVSRTPAISFFTPDEARFLETVVEHLLPQGDRSMERRIPIVPRIDERLQSGRTPGYRFEGMPPDGEAYRLGLRAVEQMSTVKCGISFLDLGWRAQEEILKSIHDGKPLEGAGALWEEMDVRRFWALLMHDCITAYYAHPWAWDEIGFGGPAYPRAYVRLEQGEPEPWEVEERRYEWRAPSDALSDPVEAEIAAHREHPPHGQGGTH